MRLIGTAVLLGLTLASPTPAGAPRPTTPAANAAGPGQQSASLQKVWNGEHGWQVLSVAFSPDGTLLATGSADRTAQIWDARAGKPLRTLPKGC